MEQFLQEMKNHLAAADESRPSYMNHSKFGGHSSLHRSQPNLARWKTGEE
jgi:hypothetical protein